jgi:hypothetical protein
MPKPPNPSDNPVSERALDAAEALYRALDGRPLSVEELQHVLAIFCQRVFLEVDTALRMHHGDAAPATWRRELIELMGRQVK